MLNEQKYGGGGGKMVEKKKPKPITKKSTSFFTKNTLNILHKTDKWAKKAQDM